MSDTSDIRGPISLTSADLRVGQVLALDICFVQLVARQCLAHFVR